MGAGLNDIVWCTQQDQDSRICRIHPERGRAGRRLLENRIAGRVHDGVPDFRRRAFGLGNGVTVDFVPGGGE